MLQDIFKAILVTSFIGSALTLVLTLIKPITKRWFTSNWHYYMWLIVLVVMLLPIRISLPGQMQPAPVLESNSQITEDKVSHVTYDPIQGVEQDFKLNSEKEGNTYNHLENLKMLAHDKLNIVAFVWFVSMIVLFLCKLIGYMFFLINLRKYSDVISCPELMRFTNKKIATRTSDKISSPLMIGLFKPTLLLPKTAMTPEQLDNVLAHEMTHFKRKDIIYKWVISTIKCIHWFNPVIYYINKQVNIECEISCDLAVVKEMSEEQEIGYINTILTLLTASNLRTTALTTGMTSDKKTLKKRFTMIKKRKSMKKSTRIISTILAVALLFATLFASGVLAATVFKEESNVLFGVNGKTIEFDKVGIHKNSSLGWNLSYDDEVSPRDDNINENGTKSHPITREQKTHNGADVIAKENSEVAAIRGNVIEAGFDNDERLSQVSIQNNNDEIKWNNSTQKNADSGSSKSSRATLSIPTQNNTGIKIKSSEVGNEPYTGFEHLVLKNADTNKIKQELNKQGIVETNKSSVDLTKNYVVKDYSSEQTKVESDKNGNISLYFSVNSDTLFDVCFYDTKTGEDAGIYGVLANNENAYTFIGFEKGKTYTVEVQGQTKDDWDIEGNYIIY